MSAPHAMQSLRPVWLRLYQAVETHVDADDREEFLDTVVTIAGHHDTLNGKGAGDDYLERVIVSLNGTREDGEP